MAFSSPWITQYKLASDIPTLRECQEQCIAQGKLGLEQLKTMGPIFALMDEYFEQKPRAEGVSGQNMMGFAKELPTSQDDSFITEKFSAEWLCARDHLSPSDRLAGLAFNMDGGLSFLPLVHDHKFLEDVGDCSSLDFALRIFSKDIDLYKWHLKERRTIAAQGGRTFSEACLSREDGQVVAIESQQSIMRPLRARAAL